MDVEVASCCWPLAQGTSQPWLMSVAGFPSCCRSSGCHRSHHCSEGGTLPAPSLACQAQWSSGQGNREHMLVDSCEVSLYVVGGYFLGFGGCVGLYSFISISIFLEDFNMCKITYCLSAHGQPVLERVLLLLFPLEVLLSLGGQCQSRVAFGTAGMASFLYAEQPPFGYSMSYLPVICSSFPWVFG